MREFKMKFWQYVADIAPNELLYFAVIRCWAKATTERYIDKTPDEVTWSMACKHLGVE